MSSQYQAQHIVYLDKFSIKLPIIFLTGSTGLLWKSWPRQAGETGYNQPEMRKSLK
jgi:hypothetical protein